MVLLWGLREDGPLAAVHEALRRRGLPVALLDQSDLLEAEIELEVGKDVRGRIVHGAESIDLEAVSAAYVRCDDWRRLPGFAGQGEGSAAWEHMMRFDDALITWLEITPARVVNRLSAMAPNGSKPFQLAWIRDLGFDVPETLVTTDPEAARAFHRRHGEVIYKSVSGVRSIVSRLTREGLERLGDIRWCPTQFQAYVPGTDYRVHVVGRRLFVAEIRCEGDDYRYAARDDIAVEVVTGEVPPAIARRCVAMARAMQLEVAGIDLRRTPEGRWYCFEVNPSPAFSYYEAHTGQAIGEAIADLLAAPAGRRGQVPAAEQQMAMPAG